MSKIIIWARVNEHATRRGNPHVPFLAPMVCALKSGPLRRRLTSRIDDEGCVGRRASRKRSWRSSGKSTCRCRSAGQWARRRAPSA